MKNKRNNTFLATGLSLSMFLAVACGMFPFQGNSQNATISGGPKGCTNAGSPTGSCGKNINGTEYNCVQPGPNENRVKDCTGD